MKKHANARRASKFSRDAIIDAAACSGSLERIKRAVRLGWTPVGYTLVSMNVPWLGNAAINYEHWDRIINRE